MFNTYSFTVVERFMRYVQIDTQSDPQSTTFPSTEKQKNLSRILVAELKQMGLSDADMDDHGYVSATIPSTADSDVPVICFCSHIDTAPDCSGKDVKPILHKNYDGSDVILPDDPSQILKVADYPYLKEHLDQDIITASGLTLLGSDDKSGVAIIMDLALFLITHPEVKHGIIKILFTPDEEVGRGTEKLDLAKLGAQFGYTLDGGEAGSLEDETFSADGVVITINGVIAHPGYAKGKLVNAIKIAGEIVNALPGNRLSPETTEGREGFVHPVRISGIAEKAVIECIVRSFHNKGLEENEAELLAIVEAVMKKYPQASMDFKVQEQYRNMKKILDQHPHVVSHAEEAIRRAGLTVKKESIRGGTDGSRLSYMGLPCPNIFTGMQAIHSKLEWIGVRDMKKAVETLVHLSMIWAE
ncbi:MAG: peptidase T [Chitinophagaceae bacterium]|nr:peptidase T [Chitinophagaceae bacterium]